MAATTPAPPPLVEREAHAALVDMARGKTAGVPAELLAEHVLELDADADFPVQRAAMEAILRRFAFAQRDELKVGGRPPASSVLGRWSIVGARRRPRPYATLLRGLRPLRASCDCPDFRRSSLGLCKHVLIVLADLARRPGELEHARVAGEWGSRARRLEWSPVQPLRGGADWLARVRLANGRGRVLDGIERCFGAAGDPGRLRSTFADQPERRLALVEALAAFQRASRHGDPALGARLAEECGSLQRIVTLRRASPRLERALGTLRRRLYRYQRDGVGRFLERGRLLLADDMGLGKTVQATAVCHAMFHAGLVERGLLIVPASLKGQWLREWSEFSDVPIEAVEGSSQERAEVYRSGRRGFLIANYEQTLRDLEAMQAWSPQIAVLDEAQRIKNWEARTSAQVKKLGPEYRLVLSGTPMENRLDELASIFDWVEDHALEPKWRLVPAHVVHGDGGRGIVGLRRLEVLRARLAPWMLRRTRGEVLDQLPGRTDTLIPIDLTPAQQGLHADLDRPIAAILNRAKKRGLTREEFLRLMVLLNTQRMICNGVALAEFGSVWPDIEGRRPTERLMESLDAPKLGEFRELVERIAIDQGRRMLVFSQWRRMLELAHWAVSDRLAESGARAVFFTGQESKRRRTQNVVDFHDDPAVRILFATDTGGVGLNLQRAATVCVLLELPWNPAVLEQRVGRIHRLGQREPVEVYALAAREGIEQRISHLVGDKRKVFQSLFDGTSDEVELERSGSFLETMREVVAAAGDGRGAGGAEDEEPEGEAEVEELVRAADEGSAGDGRTVSDPGVAAFAAAASRLRVERGRDGWLRIEAPPEVAPALAALLEGLAAQLRGSHQGDRAPS